MRLIKKSSVHNLPKPNSAGYKRIYIFATLALGRRAHRQRAEIKQAKNVPETKPEKILERPSADNQNKTWTSVGL